MSDTKQKRPDSKKKVKYKGLRAYKSFLDGSDPTYPLCKQEPQDLQHCLLRSNLFGRNSGGLPDKAPCTGSCPGEENPLLGAVLRSL